MKTSGESSSSSSVHQLSRREDGRYNFTSDEAAESRKIYMKVFMGGTVTTIVLIFAIFSIFWGSLWKIPAHNLPGWIVDFDGGEVGQSISGGLLSAPAGLSKVTWAVVSASQFPGGPEELGRAVLDQQTWVAISINPGTSARLSSSIVSPNTSYNGQDALTVFAVEGRNENAFRSLIRPSVQALLDVASRSVAVQVAQRVATLPNLSSLLSTSPQTVVSPVSYTIRNLAPFDEPVATAVTFIGLLYQLILSFFVVMIGNAAREQSGLANRLTTRSLILLRFASSFGAYLIISLFYALLSVAFQLSMTRKFGHAGFLVFWMLNYGGMLACGLALESLLTLLTTAGIPFFMLTWIITNVSVCAFPIEVMPNIFRYGYAFPFYNTSVGIRTVLFGTKNRVGFSFGILIVWISISCITLPLIQWFVRKRQAAALQVEFKAQEEEDFVEKKADEQVRTTEV